MPELSQSIQIGDVTLPNRVFLAPMSGITDAPFRRLASKFNAGLVVSEMVASKELISERRDVVAKATVDPSIVNSIQLVGRESYWMSEAAKQAEDLGADIIDINMGCPAKLVTNGYSGSALMRDLDLAQSLIEATVSAVSTPVTLKMRLGWDEESINAPELARKAENLGVKLITVHGRTRCQFYKGVANWDAISDVKSSIKIPLVVNGDISSENTEQALQRSRADAIMIGRKALGNPWISMQVLDKTRGHLADTAEFVNAVEEHYDDCLLHYGIFKGNKVFRKHLSAYIENFAPDFSEMPKWRRQICAETDPKQVKILFNEFVANCSYERVA